MARPAVDQLVPGWYPDPARNPDAFRWWTGDAWSDLLTQDPTSPPPGPGAALRTVPAARRGTRRGQVALIASAVFVVLFLVAATAVGTARGSGQPVLPRASIPTSPAPTAPVPWSIGADGVIALGGVATARFPDSPYSRPTKPAPVYGLLEQGTSTYATTSPQRGSTPEWTASVLSGWLDDDLAARTPRLAAAGVLRQLPDVLFRDSSRTTITDLTVAALPGFEEDEAIRVTATIGYAVPGIASTHDDLVLIMVRTDPVNYALWMSSVPGDASATISAATAAAEKTVVRR